MSGVALARGAAAKNKFAAVTCSLITATPNYRKCTDVVFSTPDGVTLKMDIYTPETPVSQKAIVTVHGGFWTGGAKEDHAALAASLAQSGFCVFVPNYRLACTDGANPLCGAHGMTLVNDIRLAVRWVRRYGNRYGAATGRIGVLGTSAGAHLAAMTAVAAGSGGDRADTWAGWSGPYKITGFGNPAAFETFIGCSETTCPNDWAAVSATDLVNAQTTPAYLAHSTSDATVGVSFSQTMDAALTAAGVTHLFREVAGAAHGLGLFANATVLADTISHFNTYL